jgi:4-azaleucine resistance transporter AzlC
MRREGFKDSIPIVLGYIPVAIAYGILAKTAELSLLECFLISAMVYAGASQFIAVNLIMLKVGIGEIILTTFLVNIRHLLMSASLLSKLEKHPKLNFIYAFGMTDEFFSVASFTDKKLKPPYTLTLEFVPYVTWVSFSVVGYVLGSVLPELLKESMNIALYALFIAILIPEVKKHHIMLKVTLLAGMMNTVSLYVFRLPQGWSILLTIIVVSYFASKNEQVKEAFHE